MFAENMKSFVIYNLYLLLVINFFLAMTIYFVIVRAKLQKKQYAKTVLELAGGGTGLYSG